MNFPLQAFQTLIDFLTNGMGQHTIPELVKAATEIINWVAELLGGVAGINAVKVQALAPADDAATAAELQKLVSAQKTGGAKTQAIPTWLIPILLELLKRLLAP